jgi:putative tryptophan/tyrosine transport system substrate-binding protein
MRRREVILALGGAAASALAGRACAEGTNEAAPDRVRRVGVLIFGDASDPISQERLNALRDGLAQLNWVEGRNLRIEGRYAAADMRRLRSYAAELVSLDPDVIVTSAPPATRAVLAQTKTIPVVFVEVTNEAGYGLAGNLARSEDNATGITNLYLAIGTRWLELLREAAPGIARVGLLYNPDFDRQSYIAGIEATAAAYRIKPIRMPVRDAKDIARAINAFAVDANGSLLVVPPTPAFAEMTLIFRLATKHRLPAVYPSRSLAAEGGLMSYGAISADLFRDAAAYVDRILRGAKTSELPVQFLTKFDLVINLKAAKAIGLEMPRTLLDRAAEVIE